jgi:hypothetical protein
MEVTKSISKTKKNTHNHSEIKTYHSLKQMDIQAFCKSEIYNDTTKIINFLQSNPTELQIDKLYDATLYFLAFYFSNVGVYWRLDVESSTFNRKEFNFCLLFIMNMNIINKIIKETNDEENLYIETYIKQKYKKLKTQKSIDNKIFELKEKKEYPDYHKLNFEKFKKNNVFESHNNIISKNEINTILNELGKNNYKDLEYNFTRLYSHHCEDKSIINAYNLLNHLHIMGVTKSISTTKIKTHKNKNYHSFKNMDIQAFYKSEIYNDTTKIINFLQSNPTKLQIDKLYETALYFVGFFVNEGWTTWGQTCEDLICNRKHFNFRLLFIMNMNIINKIIKETKDEENLYIETYVKQKYKRLKTWQSIYYKILELKKNKEYPEYDKLNFEKIEKNNVFESHTNIITKNEINTILNELGKNNYEDLEYNLTVSEPGVDKSIINAYNLLNHLNIM